MFLNVVVVRCSLLRFLVTETFWFLHLGVGAATGVAVLSPPSGIDHKIVNSVYYFMQCCGFAMIRIRLQIWIRYEFILTTFPFSLYFLSPSPSSH